MGDTPPQQDDTMSSLTTVSSMTTYSISYTVSGTSLPFFEAQQLADSVEEPVDKIILSEQDFTIWQPATTTQEVLESIRITPP